MRKCYLVTGAGGRLGKDFVKILCQNNSDGVTHLKLVDLRFPDDVMKQLSNICAEAGIEVQWMTGSVTDKNFMRKVAENVDVALHMAGVIDFGRFISNDAVWNVNYQGTVETLEACSRANVRYFIFTSSIEAVGPNANRDPMYMGDENTKYLFKPALMYGKSKHEAEDYVLAANGRTLSNGNKLVTTALRPPGFYGGDDPILRTILRTIGKDKVLQSPCSASCLQTRMRVENVGWAHVVAAREIQMSIKHIAGNAYFLGDDTPNMSFPRLNYQFFKPFGITLSKREPILPYWLLRILVFVMLWVGKIYQLFGIKKEILLTPASLKFVTTSFTTSHQKFSKHFKYKPLLSWEESLEKTREEAERTIEDLKIE